MTWIGYAGLLGVIAVGCILLGQYDKATGILTALLGQGPGTAMALTLLVLAPIGAVIVVVKCPPGETFDFGRWLRRVLFPAPRRARRRK